MLIIDDFLANGQAVDGLLTIAQDADLNVVVPVLSLKKLSGRQLLDKRGIHVEICRN